MSATLVLSVMRAILMSKYSSEMSRLYIALDVINAMLECEKKQ